jgi:hypothetical protein
MKGKKIMEFSAWLTVDHHEDENAPTIFNGGVGLFCTRAAARIIASQLGRTTTQRVTVQIFDDKRAK